MRFSLKQAYRAANGKSMKKILKKFAKRTGLVNILKGRGSGIPGLFDDEWYKKYYLLEEKSRK